MTLTPKNIIYLFSIVILIFSPEIYSKEKIEDKILNELSSNNQKKINQAISNIKKNKPEKLISKLVKYILTAGDSEKRDIMITALKSFPKNDILLSWIEILEKTSHPELKKDIIEYISGSNDKRIVTAVARQLKSPFHIVRKSAAIILDKIGDDRMFPYILRLANSKNPVFRIYALEAMFYLYDRRFYLTLIGMLKDENKSVRIYTLRCLLKNQLRESLYLIRDIALKDKDHEVRINAIEITGEFHDGKSLYLLLKTLTDKKRDVRYAAVKSLYKLSMQNSIYPLSNQLQIEKDNKIKIMIIETFIKLKKGGDIRGLKRILLTDNDYVLRIKSAYTLGLIREEKAVQILIQGLKDSDFRVRAEVSNSLGYYRSRLVIPSLLDLVKNDNARYTRSAALYSIKKINDKRAILQLFDLYTVETDPVFKKMLRGVLYFLIKQHR